VTPDNPNPGVHLTVSLIRGAQAAGIQGLKALIMTPPANTPGDQPVASEVRQVYSVDDVYAASGWSLGVLAYRALTRKFPQAQVYLVVTAASGGATATQTLTFAATPTTDMSWTLTIKGVEFQLSWLVGQTATEAAVAAVAVINEKIGETLVTASNVAGVLTLTFSTKGLAGNDVAVRIKKLTGAGGTATLGGATLAGGATEIDMSSAIAGAMATQEFDFIVPCVSNTDVVGTGTSTNPYRLRTYISAHLTGSDAKLQQMVVGTTGTWAQSIAASDVLNFANGEYVCMQASEDLPCEVAARECGNRMARRQAKSNANRTKQLLDGMKGAADKFSNIPGEGQFRSLFDHGVTVISYTPNGEPLLMRPITSYHLDTSGNLDKRAKFTAEVDALYDVAKSLRVRIPQEFMTSDGQLDIIPNAEEGDDLPPEGTVEERDVEAFVAAEITSFWVPKGIISGPAFEQARKDGSFWVRVNTTDETQVDIFLPLKVVPNTAKIGVNVAKEQ
jgi:phage tail sheath gpL-like